MLYRYDFDLLLFDVNLHLEIEEIQEISEDEISKMTFNWLQSLQDGFRNSTNWFAVVRTPSVLSKLEDSLMETMQNPLKHMYVCLIFSFSYLLNSNSKTTLQELSFHVIGENYDFWNLFFMNPLLLQYKNVIQELFATISINFSINDVVRMFEERGSPSVEESNLGVYVWGNNNNMMENSDVKTRYGSRCCSKLVASYM
jgi:hypothetical protein